MSTTAGVALYLLLGLGWIAWDHDGEALESPLWTRWLFWPVPAFAELAHRLGAGRGGV